MCKERLRSPEVENRNSKIEIGKGGEKDQLADKKWKLKSELEEGPTLAKPARMGHPQPAFRNQGAATRRVKVAPPAEKKDPTLAKPARMGHPQTAFKD